MPVVALASALMLALLYGGSISLALAAETSAKPESAISVSLADLLADKQRYQDKLVRIRGYLSVQVENHSLFANAEEADTMTGDFKKGVWLDLSMAEHDRFRRFHHSYGRVTGRFRTSDCNGHFCLFGGSLDEVQIRAR